MHCIRSSFLTLRILIKCYKRSVEGPISFFKYSLLIMLLQLSHFPPFIPLHPAHPLPPVFPHFSSCPWVIHINSLASTFPILFLPSNLSIFYLLFMLLILCTLSPSHFPAENPPSDHHFCDSVPVLIVCLVYFCFCFRCGCY